VTKKSLRDLVEAGAARYHHVPRELWALALDAIAQGALPVSLPNSASLDSRSSGGRVWRELFAETSRVTQYSNAAAFAGWTQDVMLNPDEFEKWLQTKKDDDRPAHRQPGPKSHQAELCKTFDNLLAEGHRFMNKKAAWKMVLTHLGVTPETQQGYSYDTFLKATKVSYAKLKSAN
jgi:hypothetical protein